MIKKISKKKNLKKTKSHPWWQNIGSHHLPRYTRYRVIAGRVIKGGDCNIFVTVILSTSFCPWRTLSWCRRTSVRPPDDMEKSVAHRLHCAMPQSGNFAIQAKSLPILIKFAFSLWCQFSLGAPPSHIPRMWKTAPEIIRRTLAIIQSESTALDTRSARVFTDHLRKTLRPTFQRSNLGAVGCGWALRVGILGSVDPNRYPYPNPNHNPNSKPFSWP